MTRKPPAATAEEEAELRALSHRAEQTRREVGDTVEALAGKIADETNPRALARRGAARIAGQARQAASGPLSPLNPPSPARGLRRPVSAVGPLRVWARRQPRSGYLRAAVIGPAVILTAVVTWQVLRRTGHR